MMILIYKKVDFRVLDNLEEVRNRWIENFCGDLTEKERKELSIYTHLWYALDSKKATYLEGEDAVKAFNNLQKKGYYVFFDYYRYEEEDLFGYENKVFEVFGWNKMKAEDFFCSCDIYVVDKEFTWTYVYTHEGFWYGPYFVSCKQM